MLHFPFGLLFLVDIFHTVPLEENTFRWNDREIAQRRHQSGNMRRAMEGRGRMYEGGNRRWGHSFSPSAKERWMKREEHVG